MYILYFAVTITLVFSNDDVFLAVVCEYAFNG